MPRLPLILLAAALALAAGGVSMVVVPQPPAPAGPPAPPALAAPEGFTLRSAAACAGCHAAIFGEWRASWMGGAYVNAAFQHDFQRWREIGPTLGEEPLACLRCHAPAALMPLPLETREALVLEGVTCEVCHRVAEMGWEGDEARPRLDPAPVSYGLRGSEDAPHPVAASPAFADSSLCAACHHDVSGDIFIERTFDEWRRSPFATAGVGCADCHMPPVSGPSAEGGAGATHASHRFHGGHPDSPLLRDAARLDLAAAGAEAVEIGVENAGVGHNLPTGGVHPTRLTLEVALVDPAGRRREVGQRHYRQRFLGEDGAPAGPATAVASVEDTTLAPGERRVERFALPPREAGERLVARLVYRRYAGIAPALRDDPAFAAAQAPVELARCEAAAPPGKAPGEARCVAGGG